VRDALARRLTTIPNLLWTAVFFVVPFGMMVVYSLSRQDVLTAKISYVWTTENYRLIDDAIILNAFARSLWISGGSTLICLVLGYPVAYFIAHRAGRFKSLFLVLVIVPFWTSFVIRTYAWLGILGPAGYLNDVVGWFGASPNSLKLAYNTPAIMIGIVYNYLPLMVFPLFVSLDRIDRRVLEAAFDLGAGGLSVFRRVIFPQSLPGVLAGVILVGVPATGEYVIPTILGGGKSLMFGNIIANQFGSSFVWPFGAALATTLTAVLLLLIVVVLQTARRTGMEQVL
jgi:spermidine/putrescine transport system permease protein